MCVSLPIKFRVDTKLADTGLHAYNAATYNFNVGGFILGFTLSYNYFILFNISKCEIRAR